MPLKSRQFITLNIHVSTLTTSILFRLLVHKTHSDVTILQIYLYSQFIEETHIHVSILHLGTSCHCGIWKLINLVNYAKSHFVNSERARCNAFWLFVWFALLTAKIKVKNTETLTIYIWDGIWFWNLAWRWTKGSLLRGFIMQYLLFSHGKVVVLRQFDS